MKIKFLIFLLCSFSHIALSAQTKGSSAPKSFKIDPALTQNVGEAEQGSQTTTISLAVVPAQSSKPTCEILYPTTGSTYLTPTIRLEYMASATSGAKCIVRFYVDGKEVQPIKVEQSKGVQSIQRTEVELPVPQIINHETVISLQAVDAYGNWAEPKTITLKYIGEKPKPTLHILAVGVSKYPASDLQNLNYAAKDAQDFIQTIKSSDVSMYKEVQHTLILNENATTANLRKQLTLLTNRAIQDDVIMLYFSGHGVNQNNERFFMTYDASAEDYYNGLSFNFIRERMNNMVEKHCRVIVFMDACHSGAMYGIKGNVRDITLATPGVVGFYSSTAYEQSVEMDKLQNGVFTRVLLDGLKGNAVDRNGQVTINQLESYVKEKVFNKTNGRQTPIVENATGDAVLFRTKKK